LRSVGLTGPFSLVRYCEQCRPARWIQLRPVRTCLLLRATFFPSYFTYGSYTVHVQYIILACYLFFWLADVPCVNDTPDKPFSFSACAFFRQPAAAPLFFSSVFMIRRHFKHFRYLILCCVYDMAERNNSDVVRLS
jgi:hypothetical protein